MGSYNSDSHNIQRIAMPDGTVKNEGDVQVPVEPYEIAYRSITPKRSEAQNLLVPGVPLGQPCCVLFGAHGAAVHDHRTGCGRGCGARDSQSHVGTGHR